MHAAQSCKKSALLLCAAIALLVLACSSAAKIDTIASPWIGKQLWTATNLRVFSNQYIYWQNYLEGKILAVGTQVRLMEITNKTALFVDNANTKYLLYWRGEGESYQADFNQEMKKYFDQQDPQTAIGKLSEAEQQAIDVGTIQKGMSKAAVLLACGFPCDQANPMTSDMWLYQANSWKKWAVNFDNGVVIEIWK